MLHRIVECLRVFERLRGTWHVPYTRMLNTIQCIFHSVRRTRARKEMLTGDLACANMLPLLGCLARAPGVVGAVYTL